MARDKRGKFVELAQNRVNKAVSSIRLIGNLANRSNYDFTEEDGRKIIKALQRELDGLRAKFGGAGGSTETEFRL